MSSNEKTKKESLIDVKEKDPKQKKSINYKELFTKDAILSLIGKIFHTMSTACLMVMGNLSTYLVSYLWHYEPENSKTISLQHSYFISPILTVTMGIFHPFSGVVENKIGLFRAIILGALLDITASVIFYVSKNFYIDLIGFFIMSCGNSISISLSGRNLMMYFFPIKGVLSGCLSVATSLANSGFNYLSDKVVINPNETDATLNNNTFFPIEVSQNLLKYYQVQWGCIGIGSLLTILFIVPFAKSKQFKEAKKEHKQESYKNKNLIEEPKEKNAEKEKNSEKSKEKNSEKEKKEEKNSEKEKNEEIKKIEDESLGPLMIEDEKQKNEQTSKQKKQNSKKNINPFSKTISTPVFESNIISSSESSSSIDDEDQDLPFLRKRSHSHHIRNPKDLKHLPYVEFFSDINSFQIVLPGPKKGNIHNKFSIALIKKAFKSKRVWRLFIMGIFSSPLNSLMMNTWRAVAINEKIPVYIQQDIGSYRFLISSFATLIFGFLSDKIPFRILYGILSCCSIFVGVCFVFTFDYPILFMLMVFFNNIILGGKLTVTEPHYMKVFGLKHYLEIGGLIGLARTIMSPINAVFAFVIEHYLGVDENGNKDIDSLELAYKIMFISGGLFNVIVLILCMFETEEEFTLND